MRLRQIENVVWVNFTKLPSSPAPHWLDFKNDPEHMRGIRTPDSSRNRFSSGVMYADGYGAKYPADKVTVESYLARIDPLMRRELIRVAEVLREQI